MRLCNEGSLDWIYAGAYPGSRGTARALVKFPGLVYTDPFQSLNDSQILSVKYMVHNTNPGYIPPSTVSAYMMTRHWVESDVKYSALLWDAAGQYLDSKNLPSDGAGTGNWYGFNIKSAALQWKNGAANHGIMLRDTDESKYVKAFYSSDVSSGSPHVEVQYSQYISNPAPGVESGGVYYLQNFRSDRYMDVSGGGTEEGTALIQYDYHGGINQQMKLIRDSVTGYYKIAPMNAPGKVLTIGDYGSVVLGEDCSLNTQLWRIEANCDTYYFISRTDEMSYLSVINHEEWTASLAVLPRGSSSAWRVEPITYGKFSKYISSPTRPEGIINTLARVNGEYNVWPAASISRYHGETDDYREKDLMLGFQYSQYYIDPVVTHVGILILALYVCGFTDAHELYTHFMGNSGNDKTINFKKMINEAPQAATNRNSDINQALEAAEFFATYLGVGQSTTFCSIVASGHDRNNERAILSPPNWATAIHSYSTKIKCTVTKTGANSYSAAVNYYLYDVFDWNRLVTEDFSKDYPILNIPIDSGVSQQDMWELHHAGYARSFYVSGENVLQLTWTTGQRMTSGVTIVSDN